MKRMDMLVGAAFGLALAGCATNEPNPIEPMDPVQTVATADIRDAAGRTRARATATESGDSIRVRVEAVDMTAGAYGTHVHTTGRCDAPSFESAGGHWNPTGRQHGRDNPQGEHKGDLPNLLVGTDGRGSFEFTIPGASISQGPNRLLDADGAAIVVHSGADDYRTDPSGNSGSRVACGVLG
ncbi:MAG: superoxide dismutase family protein [Allosphingosinicella sp.]